MIRELVFGSVAFAACSSYSPDLGSEPFLCGSAEPRCPDGYTCVTTGPGAPICSDGSGSGSGSGSGTCTMRFSGVLATWDLTAQPGSQTSTPSTSSAPGVVAGELARAPSLTASAGTGSINSTNWPTSSQLDPTKFYTFSVTPPSGCALSLSSLAIDVTASGTGPTSAAVATSGDAFAQTTPVSTSAPSTPSLAVTVAHGALELRVYGFGASATGGTMRVQNMLAVSGALQ